MFLYYSINIWKKNWLKKTLSHLARLAHLCVFILKILISPRWDPGKIKSDPTKAGWLTSHMNTLYFYKSFLKKVRYHLSKPARLTGPAHLHVNNPLEVLRNKNAPRLIRKFLRKQHIEKWIFFSNIQRTAFSTDCFLLVLK